MPPRRAAVVNLATVGRAVDAAIKIAAKRTQIQLEPGSLLDRWEIIGRKLRNVAELGQAFAFAEDVTRAVKVPGLEIDPAIARVGKTIWVGFIERGRAIKGLQ